MEAATTTTDGDEVGSGVAKSLYTRNSSGMVREVSTLDMLAYNAAAASGTGMALVIGLFFVFASFPGANLWVALLVPYAVIGVVWITFSLLSATFPRAGGDYLFGSRVLHPVVGLASTIATTGSTLLAVGLWGLFMVSVGLAPTFAIIGLTTHHPWWVHASETISTQGLGTADRVRRHSDHVGAVDAANEADRTRNDLVDDNRDGRLLRRVLRHACHTK